MNTINNNLSFNGTNKIRIIGKHNTHEPLLYNHVQNIIKGKGVSTTFEMGKDVITIDPWSSRMADTITAELNKYKINIEAAGNKIK